LTPDLFHFRRIHGALNAALIFLSFVTSAVTAADEAQPLRLVGRIGDRVIEEVTAANRRLAVPVGDRVEPLPRGVRWELQGDLLAHADLFRFDAECDIITRPALPSTAAERVRTFAVIKLHRSVLSGELPEDGVFVFAWLLDGKAVWIDVAPRTERFGGSREFAAIAALELDAKTVHGAPAVLMWRKRDWVVPKPRFRDAAANRAQAELYLGSLEGFAREVAALHDADVQDKKQDATLLHIAAAHGSAPALGVLLRDGVSPAVRNRNGETPMHWAARCGRARAVSALRAAGAARRPKDSSEYVPFDLAVENGHLALALDLYSERTADDLEDVLALALAQGDVTVVDDLSTRERGVPVRRLIPEAWAGGLATGDPAIVRVLLRNGIKADAVADKFPLLLIAAAQGNAESLHALIEAGARVDRSGPNGVTPLMAAAMNGNVGAIQVLLAAGAKADAKDRDRRDALDYAEWFEHEAVAGLLRATAPPRESGERRPVERDKYLVRLAGLRPGDGPVDLESAVDTPAAFIEQTSALAGRVVRHSFASMSSTTITRPPLVPGWEPSTITVGGGGGTVSSGTTSDNWAAASFVIEVDGTPNHISIVGATSAQFSESAEEAMRTTRFEPALRDGIPVRTRVILTITADE
jgi:ankyrin repeat protein